MRFRTLALALALSCGLAAIGEAKKKPAVVHGPYKPVKGKKFKASSKNKVRKQIKKRKVKH